LTSDQPVAETSSLKQTTLTTDRHPCSQVEYEPAVLGVERPQTNVLDRAVSGTGTCTIYFSINLQIFKGKGKGKGKAKVKGKAVPLQARVAQSVPGS
jgi:hypothetical protein